MLLGLLSVECCAQACLEEGGGGRDVLEGQGPWRRFQKRLDRRLEEVAQAVGGGYCQLQISRGHS